MIGQHPATAEQAEEQADYLDALSKEYAALASAKDPIEKRMEAIKAEFRSRLEYGTRQIAGLNIGIGKNPTFVEAKFRQHFPPLQFPHLYKNVPDRTAINDLARPVREAFFTEGAPKVVVTVPKQ